MDRYYLNRTKVPCDPIYISIWYLLFGIDYPIKSGNDMKERDFQSNKMAPPIKSEDDDGGEDFYLSRRISQEYRGF